MREPSVEPRGRAARAIERAPERAAPSAPARTADQPATPSRTADQPTPVEQRRLQAEQRRLQAEQRGQVDRLRQQQQRELRTQTGRASPAQLNELRAQQRQQLQTLQAQQQEARQQALGRQTATPQNRNAPQTFPQITSRIAPEIARQGRFAAAFAPRNAQARVETLPNWAAWQKRRRAAFVAWAGPVFWPYAYTDMFYYAFWPAAYDDGYWAYAYDDFLDGTYWAYGNPYAAYAYAGPNPETAGLAAGPQRGRAADGRGQIAATCEQTANIANWPFGQIEAAIAPTPQQQALLEDLKRAANRAGGMLKSSCPTTYPLTPPGRLQAMTGRLEAMLSAIDIVRPPLAQFYDSLTDEQKARFNAIGPEPGRETKHARVSEPQANACAGSKPGLIDLPIEQIEGAIRPSSAQLQALDRLRNASRKAIETLESACPDSIAQTPVGRLDAMHDRLAAMVTAAKELQPALNGFYASLNNEQKAAFNTLGRG